jgi:hypothetical protein
MQFIVLLAIFIAVVASPWDKYNLAPESRSIRPVAIHSTHGSVQNPTNILMEKPTTIVGKGSYIVIDFSKNIGGFITIHVAGVSNPSRIIGLAFSESSTNIGTTSDYSTGRGDNDGAIRFSMSTAGNYTTPPALLRGGFRYMTIFHDTDGQIVVDRVSVHFTSSPNMKNPRAYPNYFYSSDDLLNRIWYAGAYTVQLCTFPSNQGRAYPYPKTLWDNSFTISEGDSVLTDGAKRDRTIWSGDMGISIPTAFVSTNDLIPVRNALTTLLKMQRSSGELSWSGPALSLWGSDTYHMWTLMGSAFYYEFTRDKEWIKQYLIKIYSE